MAFAHDRVIAFVMLPAWRLRWDVTVLPLRIRPRASHTRAGYLRVLSHAAASPVFRRFLARGSVLFLAIYSSLYIPFTSCMITVCCKHLLSLRGALAVLKYFSSVPK